MATLLRMDWVACFYLRLVASRAVAVSFLPKYCVIKSHKLAEVTCKFGLSRTRADKTILWLQEEKIMSENGPDDERLEGIYERLEELDPNTFETRAAQLLHGLGFSKTMMARKTKDMSGVCLITLL